WRGSRGDCDAVFRGEIDAGGGECLRHQRERGEEEGLSRAGAVAEIFQQARGGADGGDDRGDDDVEERAGGAGGAGGEDCGGGEGRGGGGDVEIDVVGEVEAGVGLWRGGFGGGGGGGADCFQGFGERCENAGDAFGGHGDGVSIRSKREHHSNQLR